MKRILFFLSLFLCTSLSYAIETRLSVLPAGRMTYEAFSARPDRLPVYSNDKTYKSFLFEVFWRSPWDPEWGIDFRALQAGRTAAEERVGDYQRSPMILSIQHWEILVEREVRRTRHASLSAIAGVGEVSNQFERTKTIYINGVNVNNTVGLSNDGTSASGIRTSTQNGAVPLGARWRYNTGNGYFADILGSYSFLLDFTDILSGSSPFSGWATQARFAFGRKFRSGTEFYLGYFGYTNHMAAPTGQGGMRLSAGTTAPEGIYVLYQENEVSLSALMCGVAFHF